MEVSGDRVEKLISCSLNCIILRYHIQDVYTSIRGYRKFSIFSQQSVPKDLISCWVQYSNKLGSGQVQGCSSVKRSLETVGEYFFSTFSTAFKFQVK